MVYRAWRGALLIGAAAIAFSGAAAAAPAPNTASLSSLFSAGPDMLGTHAVQIKAERFADSLKRAREDATGSPLMQRLVAPGRSFSPLQKMAFVQAAVTSSIHWVSDATEWSQHDYWASARQTLARGAGDAKNRAIVKLQALRALGFNNSDLFLTLARDRVGGPITVLTVRSGGRYYIVDDTGGPPFPVEARRFEFQPVMSFGMYNSWVHVGPTPLTMASATTSSPAIARK
jgi:predicted transglutaminase-like cysteine proteinase